MKKVLSALLILCLVFTLAACSSSTDKKDTATTTDGSLDAVVKAGVLRVGVKEDVPNFGLRNTAWAGSIMLASAAGSWSIVVSGWGRVRLCEEAAC